MIFSDVHYYISPSLPPQRQAELAAVLNDNGAQDATVLTSTHIITDSTEFEGWQQVPSSVAIVSDQWVDRSLLFERQQDTGLYSADSKLVFSGVIACSTELDSSDKEVIAAGINALGGLFRDGLTRDCTHLLATRPGSEKYEAAMHFKSETGIKILLPHWFDDCFRFMKLLDEEPYEWPNPRAIAQATDTVTDDKDKKDSSHVTQERKSLFRTASLAAGAPSSRDSEYANVAIQQDLWKERRILLSASLELSSTRRATLELAIARAGGVPVCAMDDKDEEEKVWEADVLVTRFRAGRAYLKAVREKKTIGTLAWLFHVQKTGVIARPQEQLLHYPLRKLPIPGFNAHMITVTNYTGEARDYIKRLITVLGAAFTPTLTARNTVVIAAYVNGSKTAKAREWSIPIVNHTWLEDCFAEWKPLTPAMEKYISFPPAVDFAKMLGDRKLGRIDPDAEEILVREVEILEKEEKQRLERGENENEKNTKSPVKRTDTILETADVDMDRDDLQALAPTATSAKDAREVEEAVGLHHADVEMADELEMIGGKPVSTRSDYFQLSRAKSKAKSKDKGKDSAGMEVDDAAPANQRGVKRVNGSLKRREEELEEDEEADPGPSRRSVKGKNGVVPSAKGSDEGDSRKRVSKSAGSKTSKSNARSVSNGKDESPEVSEDESPRKVGSRFTALKKTSVDKGKRKTRDDDVPIDLESDDDEISTTRRVSSRSSRAQKANVEKQKTREEGTPIPVDLSSEDESPRRSTRSSASKARNAIKRTLDQVAEPTPQPRGRASSRRRPSVTASSRRPGVVDLTSEVNSDDDLSTRPTRRTRSPSRARKMKQHISDDEEQEQESRESKSFRGARSRSAVRKGTASPTKRSSVNEDEKVEPRGKSTAPISKRTVSVVLPITSHSPVKSPEDRNKASGSKRPSQRMDASKATMDAVVIAPTRHYSRSKKKSSTPELEDEEESEEKARVPTSKPRGRPKKKVPTPPSEDGESVEEDPSPPRRGRSSNKRPTSPTPVRENTPDNDTPAEVIRIGLQRTPSKRSAATKANQKLKDEIMPDLMKFQKEMKRGDVRGAWEGEKDRGRRKSGEGSQATGESKSKRRRGSSLAGTDADIEDVEDGDVEDVHVQKKKKNGRASGAGSAQDESKKRGRSDVGEIEEERRKEKKPKVGTYVEVSSGSELDEEGLRAPLKGSNGKKEAMTNGEAKSKLQSQNQRRIDPKDIKILTTQISLKDEDIRALTKLGPKMTSKPEECTHLVARNCGRTEKFLRAICVAPFVITEEWVIDCIRAKMILPEDKYALVDKENEKKYKFRLSDALRLAREAKETKKKLLDGQSFYVTSKVQVDSDLFKRIITTSGGKAIYSQTPTVRLINGHDDRHVVSCEEDKKIWATLAEHDIPIYSTELVLTGILTQRLEWDNESFRVPGSLEE